MFNKINAGFITDLHEEYAVYDNYVLTKYGSLIAAIELSGRDPDALLIEDHLGLAFVTRNIYNKIDKNITVTQYFSHFDFSNIQLAEREHHISHLLSQRLMQHLNSKNLSNSHLIHYFEIFPSEKLNRLNFFELLKHVVASTYSATSRTVIKEHFSVHAAAIIQMEELERQAFVLKKTLYEVVDKWNGLMDASICSIQQIWAHRRFLATLNVERLIHAESETYPEEDWDKSLQSGDIQIVNCLHTDMLKISDVVPIYARIASVINFGSKSILPGLWSIHDQSPLRLNDNFIVMMRWSPLTIWQRSILFKKKSDEINRATINLMDLFTGNKQGLLEKQVMMKPVIQEKIKSLSQAEMVQDSWGLVHGLLLTFDKHPEKIIANSIKINKAFSAVGVHVVWESIDLATAFKTIQACGRNKSIRDIYFTSSQMGAASLIYKSSIGQITVPYAKQEEAQYIFQSQDGSPFYYSSYVQGKSLVIGVGPTRSGKSFLKNTIAAHFLKYSGLLRVIDIDPGTETLAQVFADDAAIFKLGHKYNKGLNPFVSAKNVNDQAFIIHMKSLLLAMISANDQENLRTLDEDEQDYLDKAITDTLELPKSMQRLSSLISHMPKSLAKKFYRWVYHENGKGMYADLFDASVDAIGSVDKKLAVYNLQGLANDKTALSLTMMDCFYRVTSVFEDPNFRLVPKQLDIDEAHHFLKYPSIVQQIERNIRTWGKHLSGITLWSQSPIEYLSIPSWEVLRSSASTFFFMADAQMNEERYKQAFHLTKGECEQIRELIPKREAYIVQPDLGISKKIILDVDSFQYVISTSDPVECTIRNKFIETLGIEAGIEATVSALKTKNIRVSDYSTKQLTQLKQLYYEN